MTDLSIIISVFNEDGNLLDLSEKLEQTIKDVSLEIIFVNDGSSDKSRIIIDDLCKKKPELYKALHFSRNFGHEAAMIAGIDYAKAKAIICMDSDLQHPPSVLSEMFKSFSEGNDIVLMQRKSRGDGRVKNFFSKIFYRRLSKLSKMRFVENASDFFLISARVANVLRTQYRERNRFLRGYIQNMGFKSKILQYDAPARQSGESSYTYRKLFRLSYSAIASFSNVPLNLSLWFGILMGFLSAGIGIYSIIMYFVEQPVSGYTTLVVLISFLSAVQFILIGILGKYIGFLFDEIKKRPIYIVEEKKNIS